MKKIFKDIGWAVSVDGFLNWNRDRSRRRVWF